jgi:hypothetical protein
MERGQKKSEAVFRPAALQTLDGAWTFRSRAAGAASLRGAGQFFFDGSRP